MDVIVRLIGTITDDQQQRAWLDELLGREDTWNQIDEITGFEHKAFALGPVEGIDRDPAVKTNDKLAARLVRMPST